MTGAAQHYNARMQRVLDHIDRHLGDDLGLDRLSAVAAFSKHHFHRQFGATFGIALHRYVQLLRMKQASFRLAYRPGETVTAIALDAGFDSPDGFGRAFRQLFGQSPSAFRIAPDWAPWFSALAPLSNARITPMHTRYQLDHVAIVDVPATPVAMMAQDGDGARIGDTIRRFIAWRRANGLPPSRSATFTLFHTDSETATLTRTTLCAATDRPVSDPHVEAGMIPAGRCALLRMTGSSDNLEPGFTWLYRDWLPQSGEELREFPAYCQRISFFPDVPEQAAVTDLFLPLRPR